MAKVNNKIKAEGEAVIAELNKLISRYGRTNDHVFLVKIEDIPDSEVPYRDLTYIIQIGNDCKLYNKGFYPDDEARLVALDLYDDFKFKTEKDISTTK